MDRQLVKIKLHGELGKAVGKEDWELKVSSGAEAIHAINMQSGDKIRKYFLSGRLYSKYKILINGEKVDFNGNYQTNELTINRGSLKEIDIIPVLEGSDMQNPWWAIGLGIVGLGMATSPFAMTAALGLLTQGLSNLLAKPPALPEMRQISNPSSDPKELANSYLFSGPANVVNEGGPVPLGYGRLKVGSQVIMTAYQVKALLTKDASYGYQTSIASSRAQYEAEQEND